MKITAIRNPKTGCKIRFCKDGDGEFATYTIEISADFECEYVPGFYYDRKDLRTFIRYWTSREDGNAFYKERIKEGFVVLDNRPWRS